MTNLSFNVAQLLREPIGSLRDHTFSEPRLTLDDERTLRKIEGSVRFTRTATGVFAHVRAAGLVRLECVRSLEEFDYDVSLDFADEFHSVIDVVTGVGLPKPDEEDPFFLTDQHMADVGEAIREYALLALPMNPVAPEYRDSPVHFSIESDAPDDQSDGQDEPIDERLAALKRWSEQNNS